MAAEAGKAGSFCGSDGIELFEPLSFKGRKGSGLPGGRDAYADASLKPPHDWEKYTATYRIWGQGLYRPDSRLEKSGHALPEGFGEAAQPAARALASASRILPLITTAHD